MSGIASTGTPERLWKWMLGWEAKLAKSQPADLEEVMRLPLDEGADGFVD